ncbi:ras-related protein rab-5c [Anaeramoeba ignava]|uniref:Ras-related protein rab-5c n=1 Tax=Anaeramoeba ignava TaxID=1746090 RepID=A0A9Q0LVR8_ANAIG|nr:ras-related protein rab-5c [Anaeramoeba ignava]
MSQKSNLIPEHKFKVVLLGNTGVGKTCLITQLIFQTFQDKFITSVGATFYTYEKILQQNKIKLEIWDTAGQERYHSLAPIYYRDAHAAVIIFDITERSSFDSALEWIEELFRQGPPNSILMLAGNKSDLTEERQISFEEAEQFSIDHSLLYVETSAKTGSNVKELFDLLCQKLPISPKQEIPHIDLEKPPKKCC